MVWCILGEKVGFWQKTSTFFNFLISLISMNTNTEPIYALYLYHIEVLFSWLGAFLVKNLASHKKNFKIFLTFLIIIFQWSPLQHMLSVLFSVSWWDLFHSRYHFRVKKMCFCYKNFRNFLTFSFLGSHLRVRVRVRVRKFIYCRIYNR